MASRRACALGGSASEACDLTQECRDAVQGIVKDGLHAVAQLRPRDELGVRQELDRHSQQLDPGERVGLAREQQDRAADRGPVGDSRLRSLGPSGRMQRIAEEDERLVRGVRLGRREARHPPAERMAPYHDPGAVRHGRAPDRDGFLGLALREIDCLRIEPAGAQADSGDPFHFQGGRVVPTLDNSIQAAGGGDLSYYLVVYPAATVPDKAQLTMDFLLEGQLVAKATPELPAADQDGRIRYVASLPLTSFKSGNYELHTIVRQGSTAAEERATFSINP
jgi:hypothetical protein